MKRWWVKALLASVLWVALAIGAGIVHTEVVMKGTLTEQQDEAISERYGQVCGGGLVLIWMVAYVLCRRKVD
jgi:putative copper export protein